MERERLFSLFVMPPLLELLQKYASDILENLIDLQAISPMQAEFIEKGWKSDLEIFYSDIVVPLYNKIRGLNPWRLHQESHLLEEIEMALEKNLSVLIETWCKEVEQNMETAK